LNQLGFIIVIAHRERRQWENAIDLIGRAWFPVAGTMGRKGREAGAVHCTAH